MVAIPKPDINQWLVDLVLVRVDQLFVDHAYQRGEKATKIRELVGSWNWRRYTPILVTARGNRYAVIDGQQRSKAAQELGIEELPAILIVASSLEDEAEFFLGANSGTPTSALERFKAKLVTHDPDAEALVRQVESTGFHIAGVGASKDGNNPFHISALQSLETLYRRGSVVTVLTTIMDIWGDQPRPEMKTQHVLVGMDYALRHLARHNVGRQELVKKLRGLTFREVYDRALARRDSMVSSANTASAFAAILVEAYNYKRSNPAPSYG